MNSKYFFIIALMVFLSCGTKETSTNSQETQVSESSVILSEAELQNADILVGKAEKGIISTSIKVSGTVEAPPQNVVSVSFPMSGYIGSIKLVPGMKVSRGQALATLQDQELIQLQQDYLIARSRVNFLQKEYDRQKTLNATKTTSDKVYEQTKSEYESQRIMMNSLNEKLRMIGINAQALNEDNIRRAVSVAAPISGYVSAVHVNSGKYISPQDVLFELVNPTDLHLQLKVFEKDLPLLQSGQKVLVTLTSQPGKTYEAKISLISKNLDNDRSASVHCSFIGAADNLFPGTFASAVIETASHDAITVPEEAVVRWQNGQYIFIQKDKGRFEMLPVTVGETDEGRTAIQTGQADFLNEMVVIKNAYTLLMKKQNKEE